MMKDPLGGVDVQGQPGLHSFRAAYLGTRVRDNSQLLHIILSYTHGHNVTSPNQMAKGLDFIVKPQNLTLGVYVSPSENL